MKTNKTDKDYFAKLEAKVIDLIGKVDEIMNLMAQRPTTVKSEPIRIVEAAP